MKMIFSADDKWGIGCENKLLFRFKGDMAFFKKMTVNKVVIMGRMTLESLPKGMPLKDRINIVLTKNHNYTVKGAVIVHDLTELFDVAKAYNDEDLFVIGGEAVYRALMPYCKTAYVTRFLTGAHADRFMPDFDGLLGWELTGRSEEMCENGITYRFDTYTQSCPEKY